MRISLNKEYFSGSFPLILPIFAQNGVKMVGSCLNGVFIPLIDKNSVKVSNIAKKWCFGVACDLINFRHKKTPILYGV